MSGGFQKSKMSLRTILAAEKSIKMQKRDRKVTMILRKMSMQEETSTKKFQTTHKTKKRLRKVS